MEIPRRDRRPAPRSLLVVAAISAVLSAISILVIDQPLARWIAGFEESAVWRHGITVLEYAIGLPVFKLLSVVVLIGGMLVVMVVPRWRRYAPAWMLIAGTHLFSRFLTPLIKDATGRLRPHEWLAQDGDQTFWSDGAAFPSGHVTLFASIVIPLAVVVPRTRPLLVLVGFVMLARVAVNGHWASDVFAAITLVTLVCWALGQAVRPLRT